MISPASFKRAQKIKTKLSFARLVLSSSTIRLLVPPLSRPSQPKSPFQNEFLDSSLITPHISALVDTADNDNNVPPPVLSLNSIPAGSSSATSASAPLHDNVQCLSYTFTIRTILDGWIRPARNIGSNHVTSRRLGLSYRKSYAFHHVLKDDSGTLSARTLISYSAHKSISHPSKKQLARQERHKDLLSDRSKFSRHNIRNLVSSRPDVSFCLNERSHHSSVAFVSSKFTGSIQKVVLNPSSVVGSHFITDKPTSGPFVGLNCPVIDYQDFKTLGFSRSIIDMVRRILSYSASIYVPSHNFLWLLISKHNTSSVSKKYLRDAIQSIITKSASSSTFSHLWNSDTRFSFKLGRVKPCDILMLLDVCAPWFDSHPYPAPSNFRTLWDLPADFVHPVFLMR
ncbi:hypothetical protein GLOIN_2v1807894 [Rhizophagus irregularis DAOM 181602=DAOM 197198]|nr:hypothetical protein GLOIN_2v1807894 [Rhizophagus irregularis DAOM 181602=DAOM 197198]